MNSDIETVGRVAAQAEPAAAPDIIDLFRVAVDSNYSFVAEISLWIALPLLVIGAVLLGIRWYLLVRRYDVVKLEIALGGIGKVELSPNKQDLQVAHKIWTELTTRKAALPIDPEHDVIVEVYDSWYVLFGRVRDLVGEVPADLVRRHSGTRELVRIATDSLNLGLRPHLTRWQAEYRNWWTHQDEALKNASPQEVQQQFPHYTELMDDLVRVNRDLISYAGELEKLVRGSDTSDGS